MIGLEEIMEQIYLEGKQANHETAEEILDRIEKYNNYIPSSSRHEYRSLILKEYKTYIADKEK